MRLFGSAPYCYQVLTNLFETWQNFSGCLESGRFTVGAPTGANFMQILIKRRTSIKQIRVLVAFILQPEMKLPQIVPDEDNKYRKR